MLAIVIQHYNAIAILTGLFGSSNTNSYRRKIKIVRQLLTYTHTHNPHSKPSPAQKLAPNIGWSTFIAFDALLAVGLATASVGVAREFVVDSSSPASAWW